MKKLVPIFTAFAFAVLANASTEKNVTIKRDVLGRALGVAETKSFLLKNTSVRAESPLAATSEASGYTQLYRSMGDYYKANVDREKNDPIEPLMGAFEANGVPGTSGYNEKFYYGDAYSIIKSIDKREYHSLINDFEERYRTKYRNYLRPLIYMPNYYEFPEFDPSRKGAFNRNYTMTKMTDKKEYHSFNGVSYRNINNVHATTGITPYARNIGNETYPADGSGVSIYFTSKNVAFGGEERYGLVGTPNPTVDNIWNRTPEEMLEQSRYISAIHLASPASVVVMHDIVDDAENQRYAVHTKGYYDDINYVGVNDFSVIGYNLPTSGRLIYDEEAAILDDYIYGYRIIEFVTMDGSNNFAAAVNGISVGSLDNDKSLINADGIKNPRYNGAGSEYVKPEIANFSRLYLQDKSIYKFSETKVTLDPVTQGVGAAAHYTAAMVANLLSYNPFYKYHPEVVKALLMSSAEDNPVNSKYKKTNALGTSVSVGSGYPHFRNMVANNRSRFWLGSNSAYFGENNTTKIKFTEKNIKKNKRYRIAIAWLSRGDYMIGSKKLQQDIDLVVKTKLSNGGSLKYTSNSAPNSFEIVDFVTQTSDDIEIEISRYRNDGGRVLLGYNLHEVN